MNIDEYINQAPFSPENEKKRKLFENSINSLTLHHYKNSKEYKKILNFLRYNFKEKQLSKIPFLPAKLFKEIDFFLPAENLLLIEQIKDDILNYTKVKKLADDIEKNTIEFNF